MENGLGGALMTIVILGALTTCTYGTPGTGTKVGQVANIRPEGILCKTTTVVITGKYGGGELHATVPARLREQVEQHLNAQDQVKATYHTDLIRARCSNGTGNVFLDSIEAHPEGEAK
jgi:hypothetical protein